MLFFSQNDYCLFHYYYVYIYYYQLLTLAVSTNSNIVNDVVKASFLDFQAIYDNFNDEHVYCDDFVNVHFHLRFRTEDFVIPHYSDYDYDIFNYSIFQFD
jgi:hypothetical protein